MQGTFMSSVMDFFSSPSSSLDNLQLHVSEGNTILCVHGGLLTVERQLYQTWEFHVPKQKKFAKVFSLKAVKQHLYYN